MKESFSCVRILIVLVALGAYSRAFAVDSSPISDRYALVGVISDDSADGKTKGIAVLKDKQNDYTLTLQSGDFLPYSSLRVQQIQRKKVTISDGSPTGAVSLTHDGSFAAKEKQKATAKKPDDETMSLNAYLEMLSTPRPDPNIAGGTPQNDEKRPELREQPFAEAPVSVREMDDELNEDGRRFEEGLLPRETARHRLSFPRAGVHVAPANSDRCDDDNCESLYEEEAPESSNSLDQPIDPESGDELLNFYQEYLP